ncbi:MAG TPA: bifunctional phosphoribosylaminoimidazolecarboxamide formyltransferase/IMP cyclohydrolase [Candidatus Binatia bacterium]|nr:bifunctional phosphoribosylaminoimidazolecarboxamide formyltransferase/IMP cyclohydrolase [Candidatus Binatia bacterium]
MSGRIAVGVSGAGSNLRALVAAARRGELGGEVVLVFADRPCPALDWAAGEGIATALVPGGEDARLATVLAAARPDVVVLAGYMRIVGPAVLAAYRNRILNTHPSLLPAFPGAHAVRDALAHGVAVTGCTVHLVDEVLDGGPIVLQEAVPVLPGDDEATLHDRIRAVEHRLLPRATALLLAGALRVEGRRVVVDPDRAAEAVPAPRRALLSVSDKTGLEPFARGLVELGFELVASGGTARLLRDAGLSVTDVAAVTGAPEMLDGRVKTLHPRIHAGILADRRRAEHRRALAAAGIAPFELVVVNLYPFEAAALRPDLDLDGLVEEIDIGGPALVRAAAKNWASVAVVTSPARYPAVLDALRRGGCVPEGLRAALAVEAFRHTAAYDARIAEVLPGRIAGAGVALPDEAGLPGASDPFPPRLVLALDKVETLRYGENPHQRAARYRRPGAEPAEGPFWDGGTLLQGKPLSYTNVLDAAAAAAIARALRGPAAVVVKHTNPCGAAERDDLLAAWQAALAGDPVSAFGGVVAVRGGVDARLAEALVSIFLEVVVAPAFAPDALDILGRRPNLRLLLDPGLGDGAPPPVPPPPTGLLRSAGGAVLVGEPDVLPDDPASWQVVSRRPPTESELADLDLAWRLVRFVTSNAVVIVRDRMLVGVGVGQTSRVDAARQAVEKAVRLHGPEVLRGAACASDAFFPFADGVEVCLEAGISAVVQPGGSVRDAEVVEAVDRAGAAMCFTGRRHFRH